MLIGCKELYYQYVSCRSFNSYSSSTVGIPSRDLKQPTIQSKYDGMDRQGQWYLQICEASEPKSSPNVG